MTKMLSQKKVDKIILVGGGANLPGITEYFEDLKVKNFSKFVKELIKEKRTK